jgi:lambda family phage tail tape measure protein
MNTALLESKDPQSKAALALNAIGISTQQLKGMKPDEIFETVARSVTKYGDGLAKNNIMQELFGKSGREMNRVMAEIAEKQHLAATVTEEQVRASKELDRKFVELKMNSEKFWRGIVSEGIGPMNEMIKAFIKAKEEGGFLSGVMGALAEARHQMAGDPLNEMLAENDEKIKTMSASVALFNKLGLDTTASQKQINQELEKRKILQGQIFDREMKAQIKRQEDIAKELAQKKKPEIEFDPKRAAFNATIAERQAQAIIDFNEKVAKDNAEMQDDANKEVLKNQALIYAQRLETEAAYAKALQEQTLGEEENLATAVAVVRNQWVDGMRETFQAYTFHARNAAEQSAIFFTNAFQKMEDSLVEFVRTGKLDFRSFADSVISDLIRIQIRQALAGLASSSEMSGIGSAIGAFMGMSGGSAGAVQLSGPGVTAHSGGIVGTNLAHRSVDPGWFVNAPRMHFGGLAGDEVPAILQRGERVVPKGGGSGLVVNQQIRVGGNVSQADIPQILAAARNGAVQAAIELKRREPSGAL